MFEAYKNTDPEYAAILEQFAGHEVPEEAGAQLPAEDRWLAVLATLLGCQGVDAFRAVLQCLPYIGYPRSLNAMGCIKKAAE